MLCHFPFASPCQENVTICFVEMGRLSLRDFQSLEAAQLATFPAGHSHTLTDNLVVSQLCSVAPYVCPSLSWMEGSDHEGQGEGFLRSPRQAWEKAQGDLKVTTSLSANQEWKGPRMKRKPPRTVGA